MAQTGAKRVMAEIDIESTIEKLIKLYPGCRIKISDDKRELVAEITDDFAIAVIDKSQPHFHLKTRETYRVLKGTLYVACAGVGYVLNEQETFTIEPGNMHCAQAADTPVWIEVTSSPSWSAKDHFVLG
jgi:mannose-6-phosphate isomerase-like protein (cupin superfamily)